MHTEREGNRTRVYVCVKKRESTRESTRERKKKERKT